MLQQYRWHANSSRDSDGRKDLTTPKAASDAKEGNSSAATSEPVTASPPLSPPLTTSNPTTRRDTREADKEPESEPSPRTGAEEEENTLRVESKGGPPIRYDTSGSGPALEEFFRDRAGLHSSKEFLHGAASIYCAVGQLVSSHVEADAQFWSFASNLRRITAYRKMEQLSAAEAEGSSVLGKTMLSRDPLPIVASDIMTPRMNEFIERQLRGVSAVAGRATQNGTPLTVWQRLSSVFTGEYSPSKGMEANPYRHLPAGDTAILDVGFAEGLEAECWMTSEEAEKAGKDASVPKYVKVTLRIVCPPERLFPHYTFWKNTCMHHDPLKEQTCAALLSALGNHALYRVFHQFSVWGVRFNRAPIKLKCDGALGERQNQNLMNLALSERPDCFDGHFSEMERAEDLLGAESVREVPVGITAKTTLTFVYDEVVAHTSPPDTTATTKGADVPLAASKEGGVTESTTKEQVRTPRWRLDGLTPLVWFIGDHRAIHIPTKRSL